jgi:flagellar biogenesis protein FliO
MRLLQGVRPSLDEALAPEVQGLAGWVLSLVRGRRGRRVSQQKQLQLVETLPLGGRRQLMLVTCAGESFLVGGSFESVETIVRLKAGATLDFAADRLDESCR